MTLEMPAKCKECGGSELAWFASLRNSGTAQDGRLRLHEVQPIFVLGCEECSETLMVVHGDEIAGILNRSFEAKKRQHEKEAVKTEH